MYINEITTETLKEYKSTEKFPITCTYCDSTFDRLVNSIRINIKDRRTAAYCSPTCGMRHKRDMEAKSPVKVNCTECGTEVTKYPKDIKKTRNSFCSKSCAASYNNKNKQHGNRRSKLEKWLEIQLTALFPTTEILYNNKEIIGSELDIYIPELKLAIEINGIFHYENIYGNDKLIQIQHNDKIKLKQCADLSIILEEIDLRQYVSNKSGDGDILSRIISLFKTHNLHPTQVPNYSVAEALVYKKYELTPKEKRQIKSKKVKLIEKRKRKDESVKWYRKFKESSHLTLVDFYNNCSYPHSFTMFTILLRQHNPELKPYIRNRKRGS